MIFVSSIFEFLLNFRFVHLCQEAMRDFRSGKAQALVATNDFRFLDFRISSQFPFCASLPGSDA